MIITFLGSGAADWSYKEHGHMEGFRRNSSALIDGCLLIDPGPCVPEALKAFGKEAKNIRYIINTHRHSDHYSKETLAYLESATFYSLDAGQTENIGKYTVTALRANYSTCMDAVHFIISDGEKKLFYGLDGAWLLYDEVSAIKKEGIDLAVLDATVGDIEGDYRIFEHNSLSMVREIKASLCKYVKRWMISHMARTLHTSHDVLSREMHKYGIEVAYDGLKTEI